MDLDLIDACKYDSIEDVTYLIKKGANVNMKNKYGDTLLTIACENKNLEIIKYLVEKKAKINISNSTGNSYIFHIYFIYFNNNNYFIKIVIIINLCYIFISYKIYKISIYVIIFIFYYNKL